MFLYKPNDFAKHFFNLTQDEYTNSGMTPLLENTLGKSNYDKYVFAQYPLVGNAKIGEVSIHIGDVGQHESKHYKVIGTIEEI